MKFSNAPSALPSKVFAVAVIGAGQLGSRYLQGLAAVEELTLRVYVCDPRQEGLDQSRQRWREAGGQRTDHELKLITNVEHLPRHIDLAIVATTADIRPAVVNSIAHHSLVRYWILEKVLAQSLTGLKKLEDAVVGSGTCWVNTPRRIMKWHRRLKQQLSGQSELSVIRHGPQWGLLCNAIHYLDLVAWLTGEKLVSVRPGPHGIQWTDAKRRGFVEAVGTLEARFSGGTMLSLSVDPAANDEGVTVRGTDGAYHLNEIAGQGVGPLDEPFHGDMELQSEITSQLVENILTSGFCGLPSFEESAPLHEKLLAGLLEEWNRTHPLTDTIRIT